MLPGFMPSRWIGRGPRESPSIMPELGSICPDAASRHGPLHGIPKTRPVPAQMHGPRVDPREERSSPNRGCARYVRHSLTGRLGVEPGAAGRVFGIAAATRLKRFIAPPRPCSRAASPRTAG